MIQVILQNFVRQSVCLIELRSVKRMKERPGIFQSGTCGIDIGRKRTIADRSVFDVIVLWIFQGIVQCDGTSGDFLQKQVIGKGFKRTVLKYEKMRI